jgi:hypothetical protein
MQSRYLSLAIRAVVFAAGILLIVWPMLYNRYPLVYSDTGTYLRNSVLLLPDPDRPIGYGIFIRLMSWQAITWNVVFGQAVIIWIVTFRTVKLHSTKPLLPHFLVLCVLSAASGLPVYASQLMPDVFAGIVVLTVYLLFRDTPNIWRFIAYGLLLTCLVTTHFSFFLVAGMTAGTMALFSIRRIFTTQKPVLYRALGTGAFLGLAVLGVMSYNYVKKDRFKFSFSSNVFLTAKFCEGGILQAYLKDNCGKKNMPLCPVKDEELNPMRFLWDPNFPLTTHYYLNWEKANDEFAVIVDDVFATPKYRRMFIREAWRATGEQLTQTRIGSGLKEYRSLNGPPGDIISKEFRNELGQFLGSRQNHEKMEDWPVNGCVDGILLASLAIIVIGLCIRSIREKCWRLLAICALGVLYNAFVTAALANVYDRLQARITWLLVFAALIALLLFAKELVSRGKKRRPAAEMA